MFDSFNDDDHRDHDSLGQRISSPDFVDVEISALCWCCQLPRTHNTLRSHRQHAAYRTRIPATTTRAGGDARRERVMDRTTTMWVSPCHRFSFLSVLPFLLPLPCVDLCCESVCTWRTHANTSFFSDTGLPSCVLPSRPRPSPDLPACASNSYATRLGRRASTSTQFTRHPRPRVPLQTYLDLNPIYVVSP